MMSPSALMKVLVARILPSPWLDNREGDVPVRGGRYGEQYTMSVVRKQHLLADEGSYFVTNNAQTGIATPAVATFGATTPMMTIYNGNTDGRRLYLDYLDLVTTAAGSWASAGVNLQMVIVTDNGNRFTSGGTDISSKIVNPNMDSANGVGNVVVNFGAITATAATGLARTVSGLRILRPAVSATVADVIGETKRINFGGVEAMLNGNITVANANMISVPAPPVIIGSGQTALIYFIMNGTTPAAASYAPECAFFLR